MELKQRIMIVDTNPNIKFNKEDTLAVYVGRFQIPHIGHAHIIHKGLEIADKVLALVGSANESPSFRNPFNVSDRITMLRTYFNPSNILDRIIYDEIQDDLYGNMWYNNLDQITNGYGYKNIVLIGHHKDSSSDYLHFTNIKNVVEFDAIPGIHSSDIRKMYFTEETKNEVHDRDQYDKLSAGTINFLSLHMNTKEYYNIQNELKAINKNKEMWKNSPYPPLFVTTDACVVCREHVLVIRRKNYPGKGLLALPGGYLNENEDIQDGTMRELLEETSLTTDIDYKVITNSIKLRKEFSHPQRSERGRIITFASLIMLDQYMLMDLYDCDEDELPFVRGGDDAEKAFWLPLKDLNSRRAEFFEDHYHMINYFVRKAIY